MKLAELGFAPTLSDIKEIGTDHVNIKEIEKAQQIFNKMKYSLMFVQNTVAGKQNWQADK